MSGSLEARFWAKVRKGRGCWLWTGTRDGRGYGRIKIDGRPRAAHRVAWTLTRGPIPAAFEIGRGARWSWLR